MYVLISVMCRPTLQFVSPQIWSTLLLQRKSVIQCEFFRMEDGFILFMIATLIMFRQFAHPQHWLQVPQLTAGTTFLMTPLLPLNVVYMWMNRLFYYYYYYVFLVCKICRIIWRESSSSGHEAVSDTCVFLTVTSCIVGWYPQECRCYVSLHRAQHLLNWLTWCVFPSYSIL
jgi:hypothetical protein